MRVSQYSAAITATAIAVFASAATAIELPIRGVFGDPKNRGCDSVRSQEEGAYIGFNAGGLTGENGEGGCRFGQVKALSKNRYRLIGSCASLDSKPISVVRNLTVFSNDRIFYDGTIYDRCR